MVTTEVKDLISIICDYQSKRTYGVLIGGKEGDPINLMWEEFKNFLVFVPCFSGGGGGTDSKGCGVPRGWRGTRVWRAPHPPRSPAVHLCRASAVAYDRRIRCGPQGKGPEAL